MNILVVSDTHGNQKAMREAVSRRGPFDALIHLGDGIQDGIDVARESGIAFHGVRGNEDYAALVPDTLRLALGTWTLFLMHGHQMDMSSYQSGQVWETHLSAMADRARKEQAQVFFFGHTHCPLLRVQDGIVITNPGDQYIGSTMPPTYAALELFPDTLHIKIVQQDKERGFATILEYESHQCHAGG